MRLIPDIRSWIGRKYGEVRYYVIQMLSGHGYLKKYLHRMGETLCCLYEIGKIIDDAENTVFKCACWQSFRFVLTSVIGTITITDIVGAMITCRENRASVTREIWRLRNV